MSAVYSKATLDVHERAKELLDQFHLDLVDRELRIDYLFANATVNSDGAPTGPALKHGGYPAAAIARVIPIKDRVMGRGDCEIVIDNDQWPLLNDDEKNALLDHELEHFTLQKDKYGEPIVDDIGRPKLKLKKHDHQFGWFDQIARRYGIASGEVRQFANLCYDDCGQYYLPHIGVSDHDSVKQSVRALMPVTRNVSAPIRQFVKKMRKTLGKGGHD